MLVDHDVSSFGSGHRCNNNHDLCFVEKKGNYVMTLTNVESSSMMMKMERSKKVFTFLIIDEGSSSLPRIAAVG